MTATPPTAPDHPAALRWSPLERVAFRFVVCYFALFACASLLDSGDTPRAVLARMRDAVVPAVARNVLRFDGSLDLWGARWTIAQQLSAMLIAGAGAALWSLGSRRAEYRRLHGWLRIVLRYYVATIMLVYGGVKIIDSQFPPIQLDQLAAPIGSLSPMSLLWIYMGYSSLYAGFTGFGEAIGAFLLFFRRTTTAGALLLVAVLSNVVLINFIYDVPVKQFSTNLLIAVVVLIVPDIPRLLAVFMYNEPARPADLGFVFPSWLSRLRRFVKPTIVVAAACLPLIGSFAARRSIMRRPPLFGVYDVEQFSAIGDATSALTSARAATAPAAGPTRWRTVVFPRIGMMSVRTMDDSIHVFSIVVDTVSRRIIARVSRGVRVADTLTYDQVAPDDLRLRGTLGNDSVNATLHRLDERKIYRLTK